MDSEIDRMKSIVRTSPGFKEEDYRWPLEGPGLLRFTNKVDVNEDFGQVWDARGMNNIDDIEARPRLSKEKINEGAIVLVEYTITPYLGSRGTASKEGFGPGATLEMLSIGLLKVPDPRFDVGFPKKKRRVGGN
jgi:hypothetical protein